MSMYQIKCEMYKLNNDVCNASCASANHSTLIKIKTIQQCCVVLLGVTGIALAMAGATVTLSDLPHITHLTEHNLELNLGSEPCHAKVRTPAFAVASRLVCSALLVGLNGSLLYKHVHSCWDGGSLWFSTCLANLSEFALVASRVLQVVAHCWGEDVTPLMPPPDLITGADVVYQQEHFDALISTLQDLAAPHTVIYLAFKLRGEWDHVEITIKVSGALIMLSSMCTY